MRAAFSAHADDWRKSNAGPVIWFRKRFFRHILRPINRMQLTPEVIGRSLAIGLFWGSSGSVGFQFIGIGVCWAIARRMNMPFSVTIAAILTNITNPLTITPAYTLFILTGCAISPGCMGGAALVSDLVARMQNDGMIAVLQDSGYLLLLAFLGSLPYAIPAAIGGYVAGRAIGRRLEIRRRRKARVTGDKDGSKSAQPSSPLPPTPEA